MEGAAGRSFAVFLGLLFAPVAIAQTPPAEAAPAPAVVIKASQEGFSLSSPDKAFQLKLRGYLQTDGRFFESDAERNGSTTLLLRRARPLLEGTLFNVFDFRLLTDFGGGAISLQDAYLEFKPGKAVRLRAGKAKAPFGLERLQSATAILFIERALPTNLVPNRDVGLQLHGELLGGVLSYAVGGFNGVPDGGSADVNLDDSFDLAARVFVQPFRGSEGSPLKGLGVGLAATRGLQFGSAASTGVAALRTTGQQTFFSYRAASTTGEAVIADGEHFRFSPQATFFAGPVGLLAEYVSSTQEVRRGADSARLRHSSWQATGAFVLFGGAASYEGVRPTTPFSSADGTWGALELVARYNALSVDEDAFPLFADPARSAREARGWGAGVNWYLNANVRFAANYDRTSFAGGATDADRDAESVLLSRFQISW